MRTAAKVLAREKVGEENRHFRLMPFGPIRLRQRPPGFDAASTRNSAPVASSDAIVNPSAFVRSRIAASDAGGVTLYLPPVAAAFTASSMCIGIGKRIVLVRSPAMFCKAPK